MVYLQFEEVMCLVIRKQKRHVYFLEVRNAYARGEMPRKHIKIRSLARQRERLTNLL